MVSLASSIYYLFPISLTCALIFLISFHLLILSLSHSFFSAFLWYKFKRLISSLLVCVLYAINFPLSPALTAPSKYVIFSFYAFFLQYCFYVDPNFWSISFIYFWETSFNISSRVDLLVIMTFFVCVYVCLPEKICISHSFSKDNFNWYRRVV